jgi:hypothetical protein
MKASLSLQQRIRERIHALSVEYRELCADFDAAVATWDTARMDSLSKSIAIARHAIGRLQRDVGGNVGVELAVTLTILAPVFVLGGERVGSAVMAWATNLQAQITLAQHLLSVIGGN